MAEKQADKAAVAKDTPAIPADDAAAQDAARAKAERRNAAPPADERPASAKPAAPEKAQQVTEKAHDLEADQPERDRQAQARERDDARSVIDREDAKRHRQAVREQEKAIPDGEGFSSDNPGARTQEEAERDRGMRP